MELGGLENVDEWVVVAAIFGFIAVLLFLLVWAKSRGGRGYSEPRGWARRNETTPRQQMVWVTCDHCGGSGIVKRDLPFMHRNAPGVKDTGRCPVCKGKGQVQTYG